MDLIYMNAQKEDVGVLQDYVFDLAYGVEENDFQLTLHKHLCDFGYSIYIEGTEYGGIIDTIKVDTSKQNVVYSGRTWHGILEKKILCPDDGMDYLTLNGEANSVIAELIERMDLTDFFYASNEDSGVQIDGYDMNRFVRGYTGIRKMLESVYCKLKFSFVQGRVMLSAVPRADHSTNEEFDSTQTAFTIVKNDRPCNHLVCLGTGELRNRHVIHLFTDDNGGIQPYATTDKPLQDSDYILDTSRQLLFEEDEVADVYEYPGAQATENYVLLDAQPANWNKVYSEYYSCIDDEYTPLESWEEETYTLQVVQPFDWAEKFQDYYKKNESGGYDSVRSVSEKVYTLQTVQPSDWDAKYSEYYVVSGNAYSKVNSEVVTTYELLEKQPAKWKKIYGDFYTRKSDGTGYSYNKVAGVSKTRYVLQTMKPSDWDDNFKGYYVQKASGSGFETVKAVGEDNPTYTKQTKQPSDWKKNYKNYFYLYSDGITTEYRSVSGVSKKKYVLQTMKPSDWNDRYKNYYKKDASGEYVAVSGDSAPKWIKSTYYTEQSYYVAPTWEKDMYYTRKASEVPTWKKNKYYTAEQYEQAPAFKKDTYYQMVKTEVAPTWKVNTYYTQSINTVPTWKVNTYFTMSIVTMIPEWKSGVYYKRLIDNYAILVEAAIEKLKDSIDCDKLSIAFDPTNDIYDIGDIVGATDEITGLALWQPVTKKIVTIQRDNIQIKYEVRK